MKDFFDKLNERASEREAGRRDARKGNQLSSGRTNDYYVAYTEEMARLTVLAVARGEKLELNHG